MNILVTGGSGFIGTNLVRELISLSHKVFIVDSYKNGDKFLNLNNLRNIRLIPLENFYENILENIRTYNIEFVFHMGAKSSTTEKNGELLFNYNYNCSTILIETCEKLNIKIIYASSASVYGLEINFDEDLNDKKPINPYGASKLLVDNFCRDKNFKNVIGLRFFNVYGPYEFHKNHMSSVMLHFYKQLKNEKKLKIFGKYANFEDGEHKRDFVYVDDCVSIMMEMMQKFIPGIYNIGSGFANSYNEVGDFMIQILGGNKGYIEFPDMLKQRYQVFTKANLSKLKKAGYQTKFKTIYEGIPLYIDFLKGHFK